jgi:release factor glutamine methyltransferase
VAQLKIIAQALFDAQTRRLDRSDAQTLMLHTLGKAPHERAWLISHDTDPLDEEANRRFDGYCQRRINDEPLAYIIGTKEFFGLRLQVDSRVLDPRADTETLVEWALEILQPSSTPFVLDLGTGSGAVALAIAQTRPDALVHAVDASTRALEVACENANRLGLNVTFDLGNWLSSSLTVLQRYDLIVSNPPYVAENDPHLITLRHEPIQALTSGVDGLDDIRTIIGGAPAHLSADGWLLLEHGYDQSAAVRDLLQKQGFEHVQSRKDLKGIERCSGGKWPRSDISEIISPQ